MHTPYAINLSQLAYHKNNNNNKLCTGEAVIHKLLSFFFN